MKNEILYKVGIYISDFFFPPSAVYQKERYLKRYGRPDECLFFYGKGTWTDVCVLSGNNFYKKLAEFGVSPFCVQMRKDIKEKGSFCPSDYGYKI